MEAIDNNTPYMTIMMVLSGIAAMIFLGMAIWPNPKWMRDINKWRRRSGDGSNATERSGGAYLLAFVMAIGLLVVALVLSFVFWLLLDFPMILAILTSIALIGMIVPMIWESRNKKKKRVALRDALAISQFVSGRMASQSPLFSALETLDYEVRNGKRNMLCGDDLREMVQQVRLGEDLGNELRILAEKYREINELRSVFFNYAIMVDAGMGHEAQRQQADDVATSVALMDDLAATIDTEMSSATMTRYMMFVLIGGMIAFVLIGGGDLGRVLKETTAGNLILVVALFFLWLAQYVGTRLQRVPLVEF